MKKTIVFLLLIIFIGGLLSPFSASAGQYKDEDGNVIIYEGLVPCGKTSHTSGESELVMAPCQFCHLFVMIDGIVHYFLLYILGPIIVLMILIAGVMFYFAGGNPSLLTQAKALITSVVIGLVIILCSFLIVGTVLNVMGVSEANPLSDWAKDGIFVIKCPIEGPSSNSTNNINGTTDNGDDELESKCGECGGTLWDGEVCDKAECLSLGDCEFFPYIGTLNSGFCKPLDSESDPITSPDDYDEKEDCEEADYYWYDDDCYGEENEEETAEEDKEKEINADAPDEPIDGTRMCNTGQIVKSGTGDCIPNTNSIVSEGGNKITDDGKGWYCKFIPSAWGLGYTAGGTIKVTCIPE